MEITAEMLIGRTVETKSYGTHGEVDLCIITFSDGSTISCTDLWAFRLLAKQIEIEIMRYENRLRHPKE